MNRHGLVTSLAAVLITLYFDNVSSFGTTPRQSFRVSPMIVNKSPSSSTASSSLSPVVMHALFVKDDEEEKKVTTNPSNAFGKPVSEDMQEFNRGATGFLKRIVFDTIYHNRDYARFYALEVIARVPYFSYLSALHFYETIGVWRKANYLKIHFAESWNEMHHLLIMEALGGSDRWFDRFVAQHMAVGYYWLVLGLYLYNPTMAYNLNQAIEEHAFATYDAFVKENADELRKLPAPQVARDYYRDGDLYMFDEIQTDACVPRRPKIENLYDVFVAIRDDEAEHVKTMTYLQTDMELTSVNDDESCEIPEQAWKDMGVV